MNKLMNILYTLKLFWRNRKFFNPIIAFFRHYFLWKLRLYLNLFPVIIKTQNIKIIVHDKVVANSTGGCIFSSDGLYFPNNILLLKELFNKKIYKNFVDCGANIGYYSLIIARNSNANIYSFEPHPTTFRYLIENIKLNNFDNRINLYNYAVGDSNSKIAFTDVPGSAGNRVVINSNDADITMVQSIKLEDFFLNNNIKPDFVKIDVEGFENNVLLGIGRYITEIKFFMIECMNLEKTSEILVKGNKFLGPFQIDYYNRKFLLNDNTKIKEDWIFIRYDQKNVLEKLGFIFN